MGTFLGHIAPGAFLIVMAVWWTFSCLNRYYLSKYKKGRRYRTSVTFPCSCCCGRLKNYPIEGFVKIALAIIGVIGEIIFAVDKSGNFIHIGNAQHITMYSLFGLTGVIDILLHCGFPLPPNTDYCYALLAFAGEAFLFQFHVHVHSQLGVVVHKLLVYVIWATVIAVAAEIRWPHNVLCTLGRCFLVGLQGTWFWQIGIYLYLMKRLEIHEKKRVEEMVELLAIYFCWHMVGVFFFIVLVIALISRIHRPRDSGYALRDDEVRIAYNANDALLSESEEEEVQFESKRENGSAFTREAVGLLPLNKTNEN